MTNSFGDARPLRGLEAREDIGIRLLLLRISVKYKFRPTNRHPSGRK